MYIDFHIHTKYSFDAFLEPKTLVKQALKRGLSAIAVTDHNTVRGSLVTISEAKMVRDLVIIPGVEVKTDVGDVIGLYVQDEVKAKDFITVVEKIRRQGGLVVLPHPYRGHKGITEKLAAYVDVIEVLNARDSRHNNLKALALAKNLGKPSICCSDAHFSFEIGRMKTKFHLGTSSLEELREFILKGDREFVGKESEFIVHGLTFATEIIKRMVRAY
ncbi:MAG: PHP domain-containing protein [Candidatus Methanomethyliaceae archaeon]